MHKVKRVFSLLLVVAMLLGTFSIGVIATDEEILTGECGSNITWTLEGNTLTLTGEGAMKDYAQGKTPWYAYREQITGVNLDEGITVIGKYAFEGCDIVSVIIPASVTEIKEGAFENQKRFLHTAYFRGDFPKLGMNALNQIYTNLYYLDGKAGWNFQRTDGYCTIKYAVTDTENKKAIIIVPGIMGSEIYRFNNNTQELFWLNSSNFFGLLGAIGSFGVTTEGLPKANASTSSHTHFFTVDDLVEYGSKYGTLQTYMELRKALEDAEIEGYDVRLYSYDFRFSNAMNADELEVFLNLNGYESAVLLGHSNGGIVTSEYIARHGTEKVEKVITLGTPYYGSTLAYQAMMKGNVGIDSNTLISVGNISQIIVNLVKYMPSVFELMPAEYTYDSIDDYRQIFSAIVNKAWFDTDVYDRAAAVKEELREAYNMILNGDVEAYILAGTGYDTDGDLYFDSKDETLSKNDLINYKSKHIDGDGTVTLESATMDFKACYYTVEGITHGSLPSSKLVQNWIISIITGSEETFEDIAYHQPKTDEEREADNMETPVDQPVIDTGKTIEIEKEEPAETTEVQAPRSAARSFKKKK